MTFPPIAHSLDLLRGLAGETLGGTVRLWSAVESHGPGSRPIVTWLATGTPQPGKLIPAESGGANIKADQPSPVGDWMLVLSEGAPVVAGQRATIEWQDRQLGSHRHALLIKKVLPTTYDVTRRCLAVEIEGWWPT